MTLDMGLVLGGGGGDRPNIREPRWRRAVFAKALVITRAREYESERQ